MTKSLFIVLDGLDGSGKGEMVRRLEKYLVEKSLRVLVTGEPTDGEYGKQIKKILKEEKDPRAGAEKCLGLFIDDRKEHLANEIVPFLEKGIVICDRYYYSTIAFQHTQGIPMETIVMGNMSFKTPDITFILDLPAEVALGRVDKRGGGKEKFEELEFMKELRENFLKLKEVLDDNIKMIDASKSKNEVFGQIKGEIDKVI